MLPRGTHTFSHTHVHTKLSKSPYPSHRSTHSYPCIFSHHSSPPILQSSKHPNHQCWDGGMRGAFESAAPSGERVEYKDPDLSSFLISLLGGFTLPPLPQTARMPQSGPPDHHQTIAKPSPNHHQTIAEIPSRCPWTPILSASLTFDDPYHPHL